MVKHKRKRMRGIGRLVRHQGRLGVGSRHSEFDRYENLHAVLFRPWRNDQQLDDGDTQPQRDGPGSAKVCPIALRPILTPLLLDSKPAKPTSFEVLCALHQAIEIGLVEPLQVEFGLAIQGPCPGPGVSTLVLVSIGTSATFMTLALFVALPFSATH